jgi:hypothetical protein
MILSPEEARTLREARSASSASASSMSLEEIAAQVSTGEGVEWRPNPAWTGPLGIGPRKMPVLKLKYKTKQLSE